MPFNDILQALGTETDSRIATARAAHQAALAAMREQAERSTIERLDGIRVECERRKKSMDSQVTTHAQMSGRLAAMSAKNRLMERTYESALDALASLPAAQTETLLQRMLDACPSGGTIHSAEPHVSIIQKLAKGREIGAPIKSRGGFMHVASESDRNCTYEFIVQEILRPATEVAVAETLFPAQNA